ncbi:hypothetical protein ACLB2K_004113 [Fragaria x ananassa]
MTYNVADLGAKPDGQIDSTKAFLSAWAKACASVDPFIIYVLTERFFLRNAVFNVPCKNTAITLRIAGTLVAPSDYRVIGNAGKWLLFEHVNGVTISGGILDGQGTGLWDCKASGNSCPSGATTLGFSNSNNIIVSGVRVSASGQSPNNDGIHVQKSCGVTILDSKIATGDDCVSIGPGTTNLWIENIVCGPGHGISIGSLGKDQQEDGVQNVTVRTATFTGTQNGVRIKSWGRPSTGFAKNILFQHAVMINLQNPIVIDQNYFPGEKGCPGEVSGVQISDVTYQDIHGTSATEVAVKFDCSSKYPCSKNTLDDVKLSYKNQGAEASCSHAGGTAEGTVQPTSCL